MYAELEKVMAFSMDDGNYQEALEQNVTGKKSKSGADKSAKYLKRLYCFDLRDPMFLAFQYFWKITEPHERPLLALIYAVHRDDLLAESREFMEKVSVGFQVPTMLFEQTLDNYHPHRFSATTLQSISRNLASSWKQAGFIKGKVKTERVQPEVGFRIACFAFLLAFLEGDRGEFIWKNKGVAVMCLPESKLRTLAIECARRDMLQYQSAGSVTVINFNKLLQSIGIYGDKA